MAFEADYVYSQGRDEKDVVDNINLAFNPATGVNYPVTDRARLPYPDWGVVSMNTHLGRSAYHGLQTGFTKRFSHRWQASATYTLSGLWNADTKPFSGLTQVTFDTAPDLGGEWGLSADDQRHRAVFNGIWQVGHGFQVSGLHLPRRRHPAGHHLRRRPAQHRRAAGGRRPPAPGRHDRRRATRLIAPAQNRTDLRVQQRIPLHGRASIDAIAEVFNVFNRPNFDDRHRGKQRAVPAERDGPDPHDAVRVPVDLLSAFSDCTSQQLGLGRFSLQSLPLPAIPKRISSDSQELHRVAAEDRFLVGVAEERRVQDQIDVDRPVEGDVGPIHDLADAHFRDQMAQPLFGEDHRVDEELPLEIFARVFLVGAIGVRPHVAGHIRPSEIGRQIAAGMRAADSQSGETVERSVENQTREESTSSRAGCR